MPSKEWPIDRFHETLRALRERLGDLTPILIGGPGDREKAHEFLHRLGYGVSLAGELPPLQLIELLSRCDLYLGLDTGPMHMAASAKLPCVAIFSSRDEEGRWNPYGVPNITLRTPIPCQGCMLRDCVVNEKKCIHEIHPSEVVGACMNVLAERKTSKNTVDG